MKRSRHVPGPAATCLVLTLLSISAPAKPAGAGDETVEWLPEIVVTASRVRQNLQSVPATAHRLEAPAKVVREGVRTTPDMVGGLPSVMVQKTSYGQGSPYLRGFTGFRTLGLVDGIRLNNSVFRDGPNQYWNTVDPLSIARYEAVMGPASVLYGSDAIGGLVNALPLEPPGDIGWTTRLLYRGATAEESHVGRIQVMGRPDERWGVVGGFSWKTFGDLRGGRDVGRQEHTGYDEWALDGRADYYLKDDARLTLAHQSLRQDDAWRTHRTVYGIDWKGLSRGDDKVHSFDQQRDLTWLKYDAGLAGRFADRVTVTLSRQAQGEDLRRVRKDERSDQQGFDVKTLGAGVQFQSDTAAGTWVYGAEYYQDRVDSYAHKYKADGSLSGIEIQGPVADDARYESAGVYAENTLRLFGDRLDLVPGARYTYGAARADRVKDPVSGEPMRLRDHWDTVVGSLRALYPLSADRARVVFAGVAQGFRAPNLSDLTRLDSARSNELETPSPDLDPERYLSGEIGFRARTRRLTVQSACYATWIDRMIIRTPTGRTVDESLEVIKKNSGDGCVYGLESSVRYAWNPSWSLRAMASWMEGRVDAYPSSTAEPRRDYISRLMPATLEAALRRQTEDERYWCELVIKAAAKADKLSADDRRDTQRIPPGGTPGYVVGHLRAGARITTRWEVNVALENLLDEDYRIHGSGVNEPGRNLILTALYDF